MAKKMYHTGYYSNLPNSFNFLLHLAQTFFNRVPV